jgi:hypothetical protein
VAVVVKKGEAMKLQWTVSGGGPLICTSPEAGKLWKGTLGSSTEEERSDYERACSQTDYISTILCGSYLALVLGDEPLQSTFAESDGNVLVCRWISCISSVIAESAIRQLPSRLPVVEEPTEYRLDSADLMMFDSADSAIDASSANRIRLNPGSFSITTETYKKENIFEFLIHRFIRHIDH